MDQNCGNGNSSRTAMYKLALGALGVVFGDIGTSPLYAIAACFDPTHGIAPMPENILGILSLVFWSLTLVISIKYLIFVLRADNNCEGGMMALMALLLPWIRTEKRPRHLRYGMSMILLGLFGAALLYGDGMITPAISVLSAVEGLQVATPTFKPVVVPLTLLILVILFGVQSRGTARIGNIFGPVIVVWFLMIAAMGTPWIIRRPEILTAINPVHALIFFQTNGVHAFLILSAVVLCITGGEALYADMGHFGRKPIRFGWFTIVFPCLLLNYFGQGALLLEKGTEAVQNPFYGLISGWILYPAVIVATIATVVASQAMISGAYSMTHQAVQLGYLPRVAMAHTSRETEGQIYVPSVNTLLMVSCIALVLIFQQSSRLAAAYGMAVTGSMTITSILYFALARKIWGWSVLTAGALVGGFLAIDLVFFASNLVKLPHGGWIPILLALIIYAVMTTWKRGRRALSESLMKSSKPLSTFLEEVASKKPYRVPGTAVFMTLNLDVAPSVILHHYRHNKVLHENIILLSILTEHVPETRHSEKVRVTNLGEGFTKVVARYGYVETADVGDIFELCKSCGLIFDLSSPSFYLGRETFVMSGQSGLPNWRKRLFILLSKNARSATEFFKLPPDRVIEIGSQIRI